MGIRQISLYLFFLVVCLLLFCCLVMPVRAGEVLYDGSILVYNDTFSLKDFTSKGKVNITNDTMVYASCFYNEGNQTALTKDTFLIHIFSEEMKGVTFYNCNLDNIYIPPNNTVIDPCGRTKMIKTINGTEVVLSNDLKPLK